MSRIRLKRKDRPLGKVLRKRRYDLPLESGSGTTFLILLIGLMAFLAMLALSSSFALSAMTQRWSSGLENKLTIEIPVENNEGKLLQPEDLEYEKREIYSFLINHPSVESAKILSKDDIYNLIEPWLGGGSLIKDMPMPGLISVELKSADENTLLTLRDKIKFIAPHARLDTHESWLNDLLRLTGALKFAAAILTLVIGITTIVATAGAVRSRMAEHNEEVELLHIMGASDSYISKQFQRHSMILALIGSSLGVLFGAITLLILCWLSGELEVNLLPEFKLNNLQLLTLACLPIVIAIIAVMSARITVLKVLSDMP